MKTWRLLLGSDDTATQPLPADEIAARLWSSECDLLWAEPTQGGKPSFPWEIPEVCTILLMDPERIARAWLKYPGVEAPSWVFMWVTEMLKQHPDKAWPVLLSLVELARDNEELALVAAGPMEDLLAIQGERVIDQVESQAASDAKFRRALSGVWRSTIDEAVWNRLLAILGTESG